MDKKDRERIRRVLGVEPGDRSRVFTPRARQYVLNRFGRGTPLSLDREGICDLCGRKDVVFPNTGEIPVCRRHLGKFVRIGQLKALGRVQVVTNFYGRIRCFFCGRADPVMYFVRPRKLCIRCMWYVLGRQSKRLSIDGTRIT